MLASIKTLFACILPPGEHTKMDVHRDNKPSSVSKPSYRDDSRDLIVGFVVKGKTVDGHQVALTYKMPPTDSSSSPSDSFFKRHLELVDVATIENGDNVDSPRSNLPDFGLV